MLDGMKNIILKLIVIVILVIFLILSGCLNYQDNNEDIYNEYVRDDVVNDKNFCFNYPPVDLEKVAYILPMGGMIGSHVTPIDHQYYVSYDFNRGEDGAIDIDVYSPGDGVVTQIQHMNVAIGIQRFL
jgi:protein involved in sex pheromone biosynthesis